LETVAKKNLYEGMFLVDSAEAGMDWDGVVGIIRKILEKVKAEIVSIRKWDDRRLAYDIRGVSRGTYIICYFRVDGQKIQDIEKSVQLSERIMRALILNADHMTAEDIEKDTPAARAEREGTVTDSAEAPANQPPDQPDDQEETPTAEEPDMDAEADLGEEPADDSQDSQSESDVIN
jgi:small subunit ribosomal protein S6